MNKIYQCKGWSTADTSVHDSTLFVKLAFDHRCKFFCPDCHAILRLHANRTISVRDLPASGYSVFIQASVFHGWCHRCHTFHTIRPSTFHPSMMFTLRFMREVSARMRRAPARQVAHDYGISPSSAQRIDHWVLAHDMPEARMDGLTGILVDEKYLGKRHGFVTLVLNAATAEPIFMGAGRNGKCLRDFFATLTARQRADILYLGVDRASAFSSAARQYLPNVSICYDPYHLVSNMNDVVDKVRRSEQDKDRSDAFQCVVAGARYLLLKAPKNVDEADKAQLNELLARNKNISIAYILKEQFRDIFRQKDVNAATWSFIQWMRLAVRSKVKKIVDFATNIRGQFNEIINSIRYKINSARVESMNAEIRRIQARSCGLFDINYLFLKLRQSFLLCYNFCDTSAGQSRTKRRQRSTQGRCRVC